MNDNDMSTLQINPVRLEQWAVENAMKINPS
jgi:hypothetical protein